VIEALCGSRLRDESSRLDGLAWTTAQIADA
jgi:hypothetical protein